MAHSLPVVGDACLRRKSIPMRKRGYAKPYPLTGLIHTPALALLQRSTGRSLALRSRLRHERVLLISECVSAFHPTTQKLNHTTNWRIPAEESRPRNPARPSEPGGSRSKKTDPSKIQIKTDEIQAPLQTQSVLLSRVPRLLFDEHPRRHDQLHLQLPARRSPKRRSFLR